MEHTSKPASYEENQGLRIPLTPAPNSYAPIRNSYETDVGIPNQTMPLTPATKTSPNMSKVVDFGHSDPEASKKLYMRNMIILVIKLAINIGAPVALYYIIKPYLAPIWALLISSIPPLLMTIYFLIVNRRVDALSALILVGFVVSAVLAVIDGNPRLLLLRESAVTCLVGLVFLASLIPFTIGKFMNRPMVFKISADSFPMPPVTFADGSEMPRSEWLWLNFPVYRRHMRFMTAVWGIGLLGEFVSRVIMIQSSLTLDQLVYISNIILGVVSGSLVVFNVLYGRRVQGWMVIEVQKLKMRQEQEEMA